MHRSPLVPLTVVAVVSLAACGGGDDSADPTTTPAAATTAPTAVTTVPATTVPVTTVPAPTAAPATTAAPTTAAPTTEAPTTTEAPATTDAAADDDTNTGTGDDASAVEPITVSLPGATELTNEAVVDVVTALQEFTGDGPDVAAQFAKYGFDTAPHVIVEGATLFEFTGVFDATFSRDEPNINVDQSYFVQSDSPDPVALLEAVRDAIGTLGEYEESTGTNSSNNLEIHSIDLTPVNYDDNLPYWTLFAADLGPVDADWEGIVELHVEMYNGSAEGFVLPEALANLQATATAEAPFDLTPYRYRVDNSINMFGGFPTSSKRIDYLVEGAPDYESATTEFSAALADAYGDGDVDLDDEYSRWNNEPHAWTVNLNYDDQIVATFEESVTG